MCDIFTFKLPEVENCCFINSLRVGMLFIAVLAVITGGLTLSIIEQQSDVGFKAFIEDYWGNETPKIERPFSGENGKVQFVVRALVKYGTAVISMLFMLAGFLLLIGTLTDEISYIQKFISLIYANLYIGFFLVIVVFLECMLNDECTLSNMDWLSASTVIILIVGYLIAWIYFIIVAKSYVDE